MTPRAFTTLLCACAILVCASNSNATVSFTVATYFPNLPADLRGIVAGDFNGDGIPDLVVVNEVTNEFLYLQGKGDGTFLPPVSTSMAGATSLAPEAIVAGDFNGDGKLDIAISHPYAGVGVLGGGGTLVTVHLGDGAGHFSNGAVITTGATPTSLATGDFNGDGIPDLAVGAADDTAVWIHLGNGDGTFKSPTRYPITELALGTPMDIATADVNHDGHLDIVAAAGERVTTLLGDGNGGFAALPAFDVPGEFAQIALGDLNGDGNIDLVVASLGKFQFPATFVQVFLGTGTGSFTFLQETDLGGALSGIALADVDTDGHLDLVLGLRPASGPALLSVFTGDGTGNFPTRYDFLGAAYRMVAADLNHDGRPDLAVSGGGVTVMINTSPRGCDDGLNLTYGGGTLNLNFTVKSAQPAIWSTWLAYRNNVVNLWALPIPPVEPAVNFNVPIPGFPMIGNVGILTTLSNPTFGLVCFDWKTVDTGGVGASLQELKDQITKSGIAKSLP